MSKGNWIDAELKWYDMHKGYGFFKEPGAHAVGADKSRDVFVHATVLRSAGVVALRPGDKLRVRVETVGNLRRAAEVSAA